MTDRAIHRCDNNGIQVLLGPEAAEMVLRLPRGFSDRSRRACSRGHERRCGVRSATGRYLEKRVTARKLIEAAIAAHERFGEHLHAYSLWTPEQARAAAAAADAAFAAGVTVGPLQGLPVSIKDLFTAAGYPCFAGSSRKMPSARRSTISSEPAVCSTGLPISMPRRSTRRPAACGSNSSRKVRRADLVTKSTRTESVICQWYRRLT
jgi:hypothetical protein